MASFKYNLSHSVASCKKLAITIPTTIQRNVLRCDEKGDQYATAIYGSNGNYAKLAAAFTKISNYCDKALNNNAISVNKVKTELTDAKKKATAQASACKKHMTTLKNSYNITADIYNSMNS